MKDNPFKKLQHTEQLPPELKEKVMNKIKIAQILMDIGELFSSKISQSAKDLFLTQKENTDKKK